MYDRKQAAAGNKAVFADDMAKYGYTFELIDALMRSAATDMDARKAANDNWPKSSAGCSSGVPNYWRIQEAKSLLNRCLAHVPARS